MSRLRLVSVLAFFLAAFVPAVLPAEEARLLRFPAIHGDTVVFTYAADLWVADRQGGPARRLTAHSGEETGARISPDGKRVAFLASYDGEPDVYVMPLAGGAPRRLTYDALEEEVAGWTPDGKIAYGSTAGSFTFRLQRLWLVDPEGGLPAETPLLEFGDGSFFPDGHRIAYNRARPQRRAWRAYRGGNMGRLALFDFRQGTYQELPTPEGNAWFPMVVGEAVIFVSDGGGTANLYRHDLATRRNTQLTQHAESDVRRPSTDGRTVIYEHEGFLRAYDLATGRDERLSFELPGDGLAVRPHLLKVASKMADLALSPSGKRVAVEARGEIFVLSPDAEETRNLTATPGARELWPRWSPDGKRVAYLSDASGEFQIHAQPAEGGPDQQLTRHQGTSLAGFEWSPDGQRIVAWTHEERLFLLDLKTQEEKLLVRAEFGGGMRVDWSPDGRWLAFNPPDKNMNHAIHLYEVATGKATRVTDGFYDDRNPVFDLAGKYLYFTSSRVYSPVESRFDNDLAVTHAEAVYALPLTADLRDPLFPGTEVEEDEKGGKDGRVRIDLDGMADRMVRLPLPAGTYNVLLYGARDGVYQFDEGTLRKLDLRSGETIKIMDGLPAGRLSFDAGKERFAYLQNETLGVADAKADVKPAAGKVDTTALEAWVDPRVEWRQMYWEVWRFQRDNFYREDMSGLDWAAVGQRYAQYLPHLAHRRDLDYVLGLLLSELGTSHGTINKEPDEAKAQHRAAITAMLGADYVIDSNRVRFKKIYGKALAQDSLRGPLGEPGLGIEPGHYLLEIDGRPVDATVHPGSLLLNKAGRVVTLTVNDRPGLDGARRVRVRPMASEADLRYQEWVAENRRKVDRLSGGRIAYIHVPNTSRLGQIEFYRGYNAQRDKEAVLMDERFNVGGWPQPMILPALGLRAQTVSRFRRWGMETEMISMNGPRAMLINDYSGSGGDLLAWMFQDAGMGPLIGTRTLGALVGITGWCNLMDGGQVAAAGHARYDPRTGEQIAENKGVAPDIELDARPDLLAKGEDPQLERAVALLLEELEKNPRRLAEPKLPPVRSSQSTGEPR
ncbi:MAG TPA: PDZ domain-containing protein [Thermoanaerobaculia bacterium]|nr:PDZ domain-containing protein [Thermoanaerobaculia bacterium]